ncbi:hypothetical protein DKE50_011870 [Acinetobacter nosocomialis]|nr:hypothetical protein DKE50_011870 [Acinetobacter nosocomialis]
MIRPVSNMLKREAIVSFHQNRRLTYKALQDEVNAFACSLLKLGLKKETD